MKQVLVKRIARYLGKRENALSFQRVRDPRARRGRRWRLRTLLTVTFVAMVAMERSFRGAERLSRDLNGCRTRLGIPRRVPDSTLTDFWRRFANEAGLRQVLVDDVKRARRRKALEPTTLPVNVVSLDGKTIWCGKRKVDDPACQAMPQEGQTFYRLHTLHAVLISAATQPCIDQYLVPKKTNEMGALPTFINRICSAYGKSFIEVVVMDAGMTSAENARHITKVEMRYVMTVNDAQPTLLDEAERLCGWGEHKQVNHVREYATPWEKYRGKWIRRELFRSAEIKGWARWASARQVWRVKQTVKSPDGRLHVSNRYFITSLPWDRLNARQILTLVRLRWGVENGCHWTLDVALGEDRNCWCKSGKALRMLSWMRLLAYNALRFLRDRYLRSSSNRALPWDELRRRLTAALMLPQAWSDLDSGDVAAQGA